MWIWMSVVIACAFALLFFRMGRRHHRRHGYALIGRRIAKRLDLDSEQSALLQQELDGLRSDFRALRDGKDELWTEVRRFFADDNASSMGMQQQIDRLNQQIQQSGERLLTRLRLLHKALSPEQRSQIAQWQRRACFSPMHHRHGGAQ